MIILTDVNRNNNYSLTNEKIIHLVNKFKNFILYNKNYHKEYKNCKNYYIRYFYYIYKLNNFAYYNYSGKLHSEDGPAFIEYYSNGKIESKKYYLNGKQYSYMDYILDIKR